jgi:hypothetical protein
MQSLANSLVYIFTTAYNEELSTSGITNILSMEVRNRLCFIRKICTYFTLSNSVYNSEYVALSIAVLGRGSTIRDLELTGGVISTLCERLCRLRLAFDLGYGTNWVI